MKVLDDDEIDFLDLVDQAKLDEEKRKREEERDELKSFRDEVSRFFFIFYCVWFSLIYISCVVSLCVAFSNF